MKTRKELEESIKIKSWKLFAIMFFIFMVFFCLLLLAFVRTSVELRTQLSECQEQVEVWTLDYICSSEEYTENGTISTDDYDLYVGFLKQYERYDNCEVIE